MAPWRIWKVQTPAVRLRRPGGGERRFGAHNFMAVTDGRGAVRCELHGIARGPGGAQLKVFGGIVPFRHELIWGERFEGRTGFYDESFPQAALFEGDEAAVAARLAAEAKVRTAVNAAAVRYPWPAFVGANSNAYYATLLAGMALEDVRPDGALWAPRGRRRLLDEAQLAQIRRACGLDRAALAQPDRDPTAAGW